VVLCGVDRGLLSTGYNTVCRMLVVKVGYPALSERLGAIRYYKLTYR